MTNRKKIFSTDERKFGFIKICRAQIAALLGEDEEQALLARMLPLLPVLSKRGVSSYQKERIPTVCWFP